jgi:Prophage CP4-57 regulatory protein (AlpA)
MREPDRIVRLKTVLARTGLSRSTIYRKIAEGTFPSQLKISTNGTAGMNPTSTADRGSRLMASETRIR